MDAMVSSLFLKSPAKLNLTLDIICRRVDGYHELVSLICPIGIYDQLRLTTADRISVSCSHPDVPGDDTNLAFHAARLFFDITRCGGGVSIELSKRIPVGAGLGGGSGNAATVLKGLNQLYGEPLTLDALMVLAGQLGADVPFFITGRPAIAMGVGERLSTVAGLPPRWVVVVYPGFGLSTREVYQGLCNTAFDSNLALTKSENLHKSLLLKVRNSIPESYLHNDLEAVVLPRHPVLAEVKNALMQNGATGALMAGSGSCVFGLFHDRQCADTAREMLSRDSWSVFSVPLLTDGPPVDPTDDAGMHFGSEKGRNTCP